MLRGIPSRESVKESWSEKSLGAFTSRLRDHAHRRHCVRNNSRFENHIAIIAPMAATFATQVL
jgi:hypothetical protein